MHTKLLVSLVLVMPGLLLGCDRPPVEKASRTPPTTLAQPAPPAQVTVPSGGDPLLPTAEAALLMPNRVSEAKGDTTLTRKELDTQMPLPGQANDHSSPEFAKRGDAKAPAKPAN
jgi:hypothetical protein